MLLNRLWRMAPALVLLAVGCASEVKKTETFNTFVANDQIYSPADTTKAGLARRWHRMIGINPGQKIDRVWRVQDCIFIVTTDNYLFSLSATSGERNWVHDFGVAAIRLTRPQISAKDRYVYVVTQGNIVVLDKATGDFLTSAPLRFSATCDPIVVNWENFSEICVGGADRFHGIFVDPLGGDHWNVPDFGQAFRSTPAVTTPDAVFVASTGGKLWRLNPVNFGKTNWADRKVGGSVEAPLTADTARVLIPCLDRSLYSFDAGSGTFQWQAHLDGILNQKAMIAPQHVLCVGTGKGLYCLNPVNGEIQWNLPNIAKIGTRMGDHIFGVTTSGDLVSIAVDTGEIESTCQGEAGVRIVRNDVDALLFVFTNDGRITGYEQQK